MTERNNDLIISGVHLDLTEALKNIVTEKVDRLFRHESQIIRIRVELEYNSHANSHANEYIAHGHIEINGPDMVVSAESDDLYKSIDLLINKLDRMIRRRSRLRKVKRKNPHDVEIPALIPKASVA